MRLTPFHHLARPIVGAPMAGGVSTTALVLAVNAAGGLGFLASGYASPSKVEEEIRWVRLRTAKPFGLNIFLPGAAETDAAAVQRFRTVLEPHARRLGVELAEPPVGDDDQWRSKVELAARLHVPVVSFTFGCPPGWAVARLHDAGTCVVATVTCAAEAGAAAEAGVDVLCVQGPDAGGHRATFTAHAVPPSGTLPETMASIAAVTGLPLIAAGGIGTAHHVAKVLQAGAVAAQVGTALLRTPESGAHPLHKASLVDDRFRDTALTRAFTGRYARGLRNRFIDAFDRVAPAGYPEIHHLTRQLRAAAATNGDPEGMSLWAGRSHRLAEAMPAGRVVTKLSGGDQGE